MKTTGTNRPPRIFISAGEASGDLHGSFLALALRNLDPEIRITCLGGPRLQRAGARVLVDNRDIALIGILEVFRRLRQLYAGWRRIRKHLIETRPDLMILIDFPDFNFLLGRLAKRLHIPVLYYIAPQVWAWRRGRTRIIKRFVDEMAVILPFEPDFFKQYGVPVHYVGHPLLDVLDHVSSRETARARFLDPGSSDFCIGLLPGSRHNELERLLPIFLDTAAVLVRTRPGLRFLLPLASQLDRHMVEQQIAARNLPVTLVSEDTYSAIRACDLVLTASGTVTLETAILGTPMLIVYRVTEWEAALARRVIQVAHIGLPNLIAGRLICPEILQQDATPAGIAAAAGGLMANPELLEKQRRNLAQVTQRLGTPGVAQRVAGLAQDLMHR